VLGSNPWGQASIKAHLSGREPLDGSKTRSFSSPKGVLSSKKQLREPKHPKPDTFSDIMNEFLPREVKYLVFMNEFLPREVWFSVFEITISMFLIKIAKIFDQDPMESHHEVEKSDDETTEA
jgi:hypothetical protein